MASLKNRLINTLLKVIDSDINATNLIPDTKSVLDKKKVFDLYGTTVYEFIGIVSNLELHTDNQLEWVMSTLRTDRLKTWFLFNSQFTISDMKNILESLIKTHNDIVQKIIDIEKIKTYRDEDRLRMLRTLRDSAWKIISEFII